MIFYFKDKNQAETLLARDFIKVKNKNATTQVWENQRKKEQRCFITRNKVI